MEDMYMKPGNQERGWNDPPQFSYNLQNARGQQKGHLTRRAAPPTSSGVAAPPTIPLSSNPLAPPPCSLAPPPRLQAGPPTTTTPPVQPGSQEEEGGGDQTQCEPDVEVVLSSLNRALATCRQSVKDQVCNDVEKRLLLLDDSWRAGKLSLPVRRRMEALSLELRAGHWDSANEIHRSLMVDHVTEVSQWMVGVKRLIAETRNLNPELLEQLQDTSVTDQDSDLLQG
ncbi:steroid receptor RNA activator 1-like [Gouania willdenowi]|uniref:steroid receptor RNA activator 1-like n=1 Tax=Gouania willdenowi TaxID=441366 RepID=UPI001055BAA2|nr:steroid receptor RNA activator 1-like [Gouania willdenowi]